MKLIYSLLLTSLLLPLSVLGATYRTYQGNTNPSDGTLVIWINSDTVLGEGVVAQLKYNSGSGDQFVTFVDGTYDNSGFPGANWRVTFTGLNLPSGSYSIFVEIANRNQSNALYGYTGFSNSFLRSSVSLPVNLISFSAKATGLMASLDWATASESGNAYFDVERSSDAQSFTRVGRVTGQGTTTARQQYTFTDESPASGANYYRLKQVDADGKFSYSPIRAVVIRTNGELTLLGNPVRDELNVAGLVAGSTAELLDLTGQVRHQQSVTTDRMQVNVRDLPAGTYLLRVVEPTGTLTKRVLVAQ